MKRATRKSPSRSSKHHSIVNEQQLIRDIEKNTGLSVETNAGTIDDYNAQLYVAVIKKIGKQVPVNIWIGGDWYVQKDGCSCGESSHALMYWRTLDNSTTGHLLLCHCNTAYAKCFVDPNPVTSDYSELTIPVGGYPGFIMLVADGKVVDVEELRKNECRLYPQ